MANASNQPLKRETGKNAGKCTLLVLLSLEKKSGLFTLYKESSFIFSLPIL
jgi:hypothetical protein